jgi:cytosine/adenosine deaminase-related metal-dependent hydrolase
MTVKEIDSLTGRIYWEGDFLDGTLLSNDNGVVFEESSNTFPSKGTILPVPVNSHTHIGDSFIGSEPTGDLPSIVGPGGFKERELANVNDNILMNGMRRTMEYMIRNSSPLFIDFRESGVKGVELLRKSTPASVFPVILSRGSTKAETESALEISDGLGIGAERDADHSLISFSSRLAKEQSKIFSIHASEWVREDMDYVLSLKPDFLVHCIEADSNDLDHISRMKIPVAVTPRSNYFYGKKPDYSKFLDHDIDMMLGTDNVMVSTPDIYAEMDFIYRVQKTFNRIPPEQIVKMVFLNPHRHLKKFLANANALFLHFPEKALSYYEIVTKASLYDKKIVKICGSQKLQ